MLSEAQREGRGQEDVSFARFGFEHLSAGFSASHACAASLTAVMAQFGQSRDVSQNPARRGARFRPGFVVCAEPETDSGQSPVCWAVAAPGTFRVIRHVPTIGLGLREPCRSR